MYIDYVQDFGEPVTVDEVTCGATKHVLCTPANLLSSGSLPNLRSGDVLHPGRLYFLLSHTVLQSDFRQ